MATKTRKQPKSPMVKFTLQDMQRKYPDDKACLEWLFKYQYPNGVICEKCGVIDAKYHYIASNKTFSCQWCGHQISPCAGTIFDHSSTPMVKWFYAIYLIAQTRTGISAKQLERELGVTYKTAWRMFKMIRSRLDEDSDPFSGDVEVDETYVGGKRKGQQSGRATDTKTPVVGVVQRKGRVKAVVVPDVKGKTVTDIVQNTVERGSNVHTDEFNSYSQLRALGYYHYTILHAAKVYVMGNVHTQTIEGFWAQIKNAVNGVHHGVGSHYLQHYVNEYTFRYNHRNDIQPMFQTILERVGMVV